MDKKSYRKHIVVIVVALLAALLPSGIAAADVGPKPTIAFAFTQDFDGEAVTIVSGVLMQCDQADCSDAEPLGENMGPQRFTCEALTCDGLAYGFTEYGRIEIVFSDGKLRKSNVFAITDFNASYDVTIRENDLLVEERYDPTAVIIMAACLCALGIGIALIVGVVVLIGRRKNQPAASKGQ